MKKWKELDVSVYESLDGSPLRGFLEGKVISTRREHLFPDAHELIMVEGKVVANASNGLSLLVYAGLHPNHISLGGNFESVIPAREHSPELLPLVDRFFRGDNILFPKNSAIDASFKTFDQWTGVNELKHVSLWLLAAIECIYDYPVPTAKELSVPLPGESRAGRLDVVAMHGDKIICLEAKTSISDAVKDPRFKEQVPKYKMEILKAANSAGMWDPNLFIFLATGGNENDLRAKDHSLTITPVGRKLLQTCETHSIKFVTASAIWQILAAKILKHEGERFQLHDVFAKLRDTDSYLGLTSAGFITAGHRVESEFFA
jgi:hypothetical protein